MNRYGECQVHLRYEIIGHRHCVWSHTPPEDILDNDITETEKKPNKKQLIKQNTYRSEDQHRIGWNYNREGKRCVVGKGAHEMGKMFTAKLRQDVESRMQRRKSQQIEPVLIPGQLWLIITSLSRSLIIFRKETSRLIAMRSLSRVLRPVCMRYRFRKLRRQYMSLSQTNHCNLSQFLFFDGWPADVLQSLELVAEKCVLVKNNVLFTECEPNTSVIFLAEGATDFSCKSSIPGGVVLPSEVLDGIAPSLISDPLCRHYQYSARCISSTVEVIKIPMLAVQAAIKKSNFPEEIRVRISQESRTLRKDILTTVGLSSKDFDRCEPIKLVTSGLPLPRHQDARQQLYKHVIPQLLQCAVPECVGSGELIAKEGTSPNIVRFIVRGTVGISKEVTNVKSKKRLMSSTVTNVTNSMLTLVDPSVLRQAVRELVPDNGIIQRETSSGQDDDSIDPKQWMSWCKCLHESSLLSSLLQAVNTKSEKPTPEQQHQQIFGRYSQMATQLQMDTDKARGLHCQRSKGIEHEEIPRRKRIVTISDDGDKTQTSLSSDNKIEGDDEVISSALAILLGELAEPNEKKTVVIGGGQEGSDKKRNKSLFAPWGTNNEPRLDTSTRKTSCGYKVSMGVVKYNWLCDSPSLLLSEGRLTVSYEALSECDFWCISVIDFRRILHSCKTVLETILIKGGVSMDSGLQHDLEHFKSEAGECNTGKIVNIEDWRKRALASMRGAEVVHLRGGIKKPKKVQNLNKYNITTGSIVLAPCSVVATVIEPPCSGSSLCRIRYNNIGCCSEVVDSSTLVPQPTPKQTVPNWISVKKTRNVSSNIWKVMSTPTMRTLSNR